MKTPISPKIWAGANAATLITLFITLLGSLGPGSLDFLGHWAPLAYGVMAILVYSGAAFLKSDSIRDAGVAAIQKAAEEAAAAVEASKQTSLAATAVDVPAPIGRASSTLADTLAALTAPATPAVSFAPTQAKIDAVNAAPIVTPETVPEAPVVTVTPVFTPPAQ